MRWEGSGEKEVGVVTAINIKELKVKAGDVIIKVDPRYFRPTEVEAKEKLGWVPKTALAELVREMVLADYAAAKRDAMVKLAGFQAFDHHE